MDQSTSRWLALASLLPLAILYALTSLGYLGPNPIGTTANATSPLIVPLGYAFSIWGLIYLLLLVFPVYQLIKKRGEDPAWIEVRKWFILNVLANGIWLVLASYDAIWWTVAVIVFMLVTLLRINVLVDRIRAAGAPVTYWAEIFVFRIYFAWITLATVLNVASDLKYSGWEGGNLGEVSWTIILICVIAAIAGYTSLRFRSPAYALVVVWAFVALSLKHDEQSDVLTYLAAAISVAFSMLAVMVWLKRPTETHLAAA